MTPNNWISILLISEHWATVPEDNLWAYSGSHLRGHSPGAFAVGQYTDESSSVQAVVDLYGPTDLTSNDWSGRAFIRSFAQQEFGQPVGGRTPELIAASPFSYIRRGASPFLIIQGANDTIVPPGQSQELDSRLIAASDPATLVMVQNAGHGLLHAGRGPISPSTNELSQQVVRFLEAALGSH